MKLKELKKIIDHLVKIRKYGEKEVRMEIKDYYSRYGEDGNFIMSANVLEQGIWTGIRSNENMITFTTSIDKKKVNDIMKYPKITFRKEFND